MQRATAIAEPLYGMSPTLGPLAYNQAPSNSFLNGAGGGLRRAIDREVKALIEGETLQAALARTQSPDSLPQPALALT